VSSPSAISLGVLRIPFANREMELAIVGVPGVLSGWRAATEADLGAVAWGEPDITLGGLTERELVLAWGGTVCDVAATLAVAPRRLVVSPAPREGCDAMWLGRGVVLTFAEPVDPASIAVMLDPVPLRPEDETTPPPLNPAERWIEGALARIGLVARVAEGSPRDRASMYVDLGADRPLAIVTVLAQAAPSDWRVVAVRQLAGIDLRTVRTTEGSRASGSCAAHSWSRCSAPHPMATPRWTRSSSDSCRRSTAGREAAAQIGSESPSV
jgi:hypothetical protein